MYGIYANIGGILMVNVTIYSIHGSYGISYLHIHNQASSAPSSAPSSDCRTAKHRPDRDMEIAGLG